MTTTQARQRPPPLTMGRAHPLLRWVALTLMMLHTSHSRLHCFNQSFELDPMAIQTRTSIVKTRVAKADASTALRPCHNTRSTPRSPRDENVNAHLADLNLPSPRFDGGLTALGKERKTVLENPSALEIPTSKTTQKHVSPASPVGIEETIQDTSPPEKQTQPAVTIIENPSPPPTRESPTTLDDNTVLCSALKNPSPAPKKGEEVPREKATTSTRPTRKGLEQGNNYFIDMGE
jgi:hypothetical protein